MASNDVVLGSALRSNLLSLQNTQRSIDATQLRLATGKKVNSALDNPQQFFTSQALNNRASDLTRLLDGIGQSIKTIEAADKGVTALTKLVEQADSIVSSARDALAATEGEARVVGNVDLRSITNLVGTGGIAAGDQFRITTVNDAGSQIVETVTITAGDTAYTLAAKITDQFADNRAGEVSAKITDEGFLEISSTNGRSFKIGESSIVTATATNIGLPGYQALGLTRYMQLEQRGAAANDTSQSTIIAGTTAKSISIYESTGNLAEVGDSIQGQSYIDANGQTIASGLAATDSIQFQVNNGAASTAVTLTATTSWQDLIDQINQDTNFNSLIRLGWDEGSAQLTITSISDSVQNVSFNFNSATASATKFLDLGFGGSKALDPYGAGGATPVVGAYQNVLSFNTSTAALDQLVSDYNTIRDQIDDLVVDANYRGVNLLRGDNLTTFFNETNTSTLVTEGADFTAGGLGLTAANFSTSSAIEATAARTRDALNDVRAFGSTLSNNLSIIQTRRDFTQETINTLKAGASELTDADLNEEGAKLLALQTAQQLGVTALSLASQSQQSVLRLF